MTVFDIGANAGFYTLAFSRLVGRQGHVYAFEPVAENANNILRHVALNKLQNVTILQTAVTNRKGMIGFQIARNNAMGFISDSSVMYKVPTVSLDHLFADEVIPIPDVIKIDVEGAESFVLEGANKLLTLRRIVLFVALHGEKQKQLCQDILRSAGYDIILLDGRGVEGALLEGDEIIAIPKHNDF
jgi:FkbM family methyltransferase